MTSPSSQQQPVWHHRNRQQRRNIQHRVYVRHQWRRRDDFDRPIGIKRNSGKTPPQFNVDLRYSRFFNFTERYRLEVFGEFQNLFNINSIVQFNNVTVATNPTTGELISGLPDFKARNQSTSQDSRQFQLGFKFIF
jgi:hypothetical protein